MRFGVRGKDIVTECINTLMVVIQIPKVFNMGTSHGRESAGVTVMMIRKAKRYIKLLAPGLLLPTRVPIFLQTWR